MTRRNFYKLWFIYLFIILTLYLIYSTIYFLNHLFLWLIVTVLDILFDYVSLTH